MDIRMRRISLSIWLGTLITLSLAMLTAVLPFSVGKVLFWPASLVMRIHDEELGAPFYYAVGLLLAIPAYSVLIYTCLALLGLPHPKKASGVGGEARSH
jgi:hypothetical protein